MNILGASVDKQLNKKTFTTAMVSGNNYNPKIDQMVAEFDICNPEFCYLQF